MSNSDPNKDKNERYIAYTRFFRVITQRAKAFSKDLSETRIFSNIFNKFKYPKYPEGMGGTTFLSRLLNRGKNFG